MATLQHAADVRTQLLGKLDASRVSALPNGGTLMDELRQAWQASAGADQHYAAWGRAVTPCSGHAPHTADFTSARQSDSAASQAKRRFAQLWNPVATRFGLAQQGADTI